MKPNLFIVGEPKSGTTALYRFLSQHPDIFALYAKEPNFFDKDLVEESDKFHKGKKFFPIRTMAQYLRQFSEASEKYLMEGSTNYMYSKVAAKKIFEFNDKSKIIIVIRDPVEFLYSLHSHYVFNLEETLNFKEALEMEPKRYKLQHISKNVGFPSSLFYSKRAQFSEHIKRYLDVFPKEQVKIIIFDDFKKDNKKVFYEVLEFLGLSEFDPDYVVHNPSSKKVRFRFIKQIGSLYHVRSTIRKILPEKTYFWMRDIFFGITTKKEKKTRLNHRLRTSVMRQYKPEVVKLSKMLKRDLVKLWGYDRL